MRIVIVSPLLYHPACGNGGGVICFTLLSALAQRHEIEFVGFGDADDRAAIEALEHVCRTVHVLPMPQVGAPRRFGRRVLQWCGGMPAETRAFDSAMLRTRLQDIVRGFRPELAILQFPYMAQYLDAFEGVPRLVDVQDVCLFSRLRDVAVQSSTWARIKKRVAWQAWVRYEQHWYPRADGLMALAEHDRHALQALAPQVPAFTNPAAIAVRPRPAVVRSHPPRLGFGGNFGHPPNVDALRWLSDEIAPLLVSRLPDVEIAVAGNGVPPALLARLHPAIRLLGYVADYGAFLASIDVFVAPLRTGGGVKIKVLEALASARPVVTTAIGAEGIGIAAADGLVVAASTSSFVDAVMAVLAAPEAHAQAARRGALRVAESFGVEAAVQRLEQEAQRLVALKPTAARVDASMPALYNGPANDA